MPADVLTVLTRTLFGLKRTNISYISQQIGQNIGQNIGQHFKMMKKNAMASHGHLGQLNTSWSGRESVRAADLWFRTRPLSDPLGTILSSVAQTKTGMGAGHFAKYATGRSSECCSGVLSQQLSTAQMPCLIRIGATPPWTHCTMHCLCKRLSSTAFLLPMRSQSFAGVWQCRRKEEERNMKLI